MFGFSSASAVTRRSRLLAALLAGPLAASMAGPAHAGEPARASVVKDKTPAGISAADFGLQLGPDTTVISAPLGPDGIPDYVEYLNQKLGGGVAPSENFWALMWQAMGNAERSSPEYIAAVEKRLGVSISPVPRLVDIAALNGVTGEAANPLYEAMGKSHSQPWKRSEFPQVARWLDANAEPIRLIEEAARRPKAYSPLISTTQPELIGVLLPHVQRSRDAARLLTSRAMLRLEEGDIDGSWNDLLTVYRVARHVENGFTLIERLVGVAERAMASEAMAQWLSRADLSAEELEARWKELAPLTRTESFASSVELERLMFADVVLSLAANKSKLADLQGEVTILGGAGMAAETSWMEDAGGRFLKRTEEALSRLVISAIDVNKTLRLGNGVYDDIVAAMAAPTHSARASQLLEVDNRIKAMTESIRSPGGILTEFLFAPKDEASELPARILVSLLTPAVTACERAQTSSEARAATLEAGFRLRIAAEKTGTMPASLEELAAPGDKPLLDPFSGKPLILRSEERGIVISSVGPNGKDDQGRRADEASGADDLRTILVVP